MKNKIGLGIVTCERTNFFKKCIGSVPDVEEIVVVNDGLTPYSSDVYGNKVTEVIQHTSKKPVGVSKNQAMKYLMKQGCDHIFLLEDDTEILDSNVFERYIRTAEQSGIWHMNYGPGSPLNRKQDPEVLKLDLNGRDLWDQHSELMPRLIINYGSEKLALYHHSVAMFSYFHRGVIKNIGYHDEGFNNAWEHVELTYRIIKAGLHPPFWWFADIADSDKYIREMEGAINNSAIAKDETQWKKNISEGAMLYFKKHGHYPAHVKDTPEEIVLEKLKEIKKNYARSVL